MNSQQIAETQPLLLNMKQVSKVLCLGKTKIYELIEKEGLPVERFGKAVRFSYNDLQQWIVDRRSHDAI